MLKIIVGFLISIFLLVLVFKILGTVFAVFGIVFAFFLKIIITLVFIGLMYVGVLFLKKRL